MEQEPDTNMAKVEQPGDVMDTGGAASSTAGTKRANETPLLELEQKIGQMIEEINLDDAVEFNIEQVYEENGKWKG